jgi:hypothetical protein
MLTVLLASGSARAVCDYNTLTGDVTQTATTDPTVYQFTQAPAYWSAVAVRPQAGDDWDISVFSSTAADPTCVANVLASSTFGGSNLDFVIGDFNFNPIGTYYPRVSHFAGSQSASVQWDDGADLISVDGAPVTQSLASSDLIRVSDVFLNTGTTYTFDFYPKGGSGAHLLLFRNTGGGVYWVGRSAAQFDVTGPVNFVAPATGYYGVVVTNDEATSFTYALGITSSACGLFAGIAPGRGRGFLDGAGGAPQRRRLGPADVRLAQRRGATGLLHEPAGQFCAGRRLSGYHDRRLQHHPVRLVLRLPDHVQRRVGLQNAVHGHAGIRGSE